MINPHISPSFLWRKLINFLKSLVSVLRLWSNWDPLTSDCSFKVLILQGSDNSQVSTYWIFLNINHFIGKLQHLELYFRCHVILQCICFVFMFKRNLYKSGMGITTLSVTALNCSVPLFKRKIRFFLPSFSHSSQRLLTFPFKVY